MIYVSDALVMTDVIVFRFNAVLALHAVNRG